MTNEEESNIMHQLEEKRLDLYKLMKNSLSFCSNEVVALSIEIDVLHNKLEKLKRSK